METLSTFTWESKGSMQKKREGDRRPQITDYLKIEIKWLIDGDCAVLHNAIKKYALKTLLYKI